MKKSIKSIIYISLLIVLLSPRSMVKAWFPVEDSYFSNTVTGTCPPVQNTPFFTIIYGTATFNGNSVPVGSLVQAYSPRNDLVGCFSITSAGNYGAMYIYGEDTTVIPAIPGMRLNEEVSFTIDGIPAAAMPVLLWKNDKDLHSVNLASIGLTANFSATPVSGVYPLVVQFTDVSSGSITSRQWDFGDGQTSTETNPQHTFNAAGTYTVSLTVTGAAGTDTEIKTNFVSVYTAVNAAFSSNITSGIAPLAVSFTNSSTGSYTNLSWNFGDGATSTATNPVHSYSTGGVYTVALTASGPGGTDTETKLNYITVYAPVTAGFTVNSTSGVAPLNVSFTNTSSGDYTSLAWDFGDGGTSTAVNPSHTYTAKGVYTVKLTASGPGGTSQKTAEIAVYAPAVASFNAAPASGVAPLSVTFTNTSSGDFSSSSWNFGDGSTSTETSPVHSYSAKGSYTVTLTVSGLGGSDSEVRTGLITVYAPTQAQFSGTPTSGIAPFSVNFTNQSSGDYTSLSWNLGDGGGSTLANPSHEYTTGGTYSVSLTANGLGGTDTETKANYITVYTPVNAGFTVNSTSGVAPLNVSFTNTSSGDYTSLAWNFGDGGTSTDVNPSHTYTVKGVYTVKLTASGPGGTSQKTAEIAVYAPAVASFNAAPASGLAPLSVTFTNTSSGDFSSSSWDFGDGSTSTESSPVHSYSSKGSYTVTLTVSGSGGSDSEVRTGLISVYAPTQAQFSGTPTSGIAPFSVNFTNQSSGDYTSLSWNLGDGGGSTLANPSHEYTTGGTYSVSLTANGLGGTDTETKTNYITVYTPVTAGFTASTTSGIAPLQVAFTNQSTGSYTSFSWDFGDGDTSNEVNPTHIYTDKGVYTVSLTASGPGGTDIETCASYITVYQAARADFTAGETDGIAPFEVAFSNMSSGDYSNLSWSFGDGGTSTETNPTHVYNAGGIFTVSLTASGDGGSDQEIKAAYITVYSPVTAEFTYTPESGIAPLNVAFTNTSNGDYDTLNWNFGDGNSTSGETNPTHVFLDGGVYPVTLTTSGSGGAGIQTHNVIVYDPVQAAFSADVTSGVAPLEVAFSNESLGDYENIAWDFGDSTGSDLANPTHIYTTPGVYSVELTVSGLGGSDIETKTGYIVVYTPAIADFSADSITGISPHTVQFTDLSTGDYDTLSWEFGDLGTSTNANPQHLYTQPGIYTISLTVSGNGGADTETKVDYITIYEPVVADFSADSASGIAPWTVKFSQMSEGDFESVAWDFGDGSTSEEFNPTHEYTSPGSYDVSLTVYGPGGTDSKTKIGYLTIYARVISDFSGEPIVGIAPLIVAFSNLSVGDFTGQEWAFGDGFTSNDLNPSHEYVVPGTYTVTLTSDGPGGTDTETKLNYITVYTPVTAGFSVNSTSGVAPLNVNFTNTSSGDYTSLAWDFGDGGTSTAVNPSHTYTSKGVYTVKLTASGPGGTSQKTAEIAVYAPAVASFNAAPASGVAPLSVTFTNTSTGDFSSSSWNFGDGTTSTESSPVHSYSAKGSYTVILTVSGSGGSDSEVRTGLISVYAPTQAQFSGTPTSGIAPFTVNFTNQSSGDYTSLSWSFGDGGVSTLANPSHEYTTGGTYTIGLTASGPGGTDTETKLNYITVYTPVTAGFTVNSTSGVAPLNVSFTNTSSGDYTSLAWDFGDGGTSTAVNSSHTYTAKGVYTVKLTASGPGGTDIETKTDFITVYASAQADFTFTPASGTAPLEVSFTNTSTGDYSTFEWIFGDGETSVFENPTHTYTTAGVYSVSFIVSGNGGESTSTQMNAITVNAPIVASFTSNVNNGIAPLTVTFTDTTTGHPTSWSWNFGDGSTSTEQSPSHEFVAGGAYTVTLTANGSGGSDTHQEIITVYSPVHAAFSATPESGYSPLTVQLTNQSTGDYTSVLWDFGDGATSVEVNPSHTYNDLNVYTISLTVTGPGGTDAFQLDVRVIPHIAYLPLIKR